LTSEELVDIAEGTRSEASAPHLAGCDPCRAQLSDLRAMMSVAAVVDVPEPSPLFWDHLSSRVSTAVAAEAAGAELAPSRDVFRTLFGSRTLQVALALAGSLLIVVLINGRPTAPAAPEAPGFTVADAVPDPLGVAADDDDSLTLVASLTDGQDLETVREAGLAPRGSAEHAVTHMRDGELRELSRLLKEELARPGA
jgi:hypothetical protein